MLLIPSTAGMSRAADRDPDAAADRTVAQADASPLPTRSGRLYHVDCAAGRDDANGRRPSTAWRTLARANRAKLQPGDSLLLLRGCRWKGPLLVTWSGTAEAPITIGAYGLGDRPVIEDFFQDIFVTGSWFVIQDVHVRADPPTHDLGCDGQPAGVRYGIYVESGSKHGIIRGILATELSTGVRIARGATDHQILDSDFRNNDMKSNDPMSDSGAVAIDVQGDSNVVAHNRISGSDTCSPFFGGRDGSAISVYGGRHNVIDHNVSSQNHAFIELGNPRTSDTLIAYNVDHSTLTLANFAVVHGLGSKYGPVHDTRIFHNTTVLTGKRSGAIQCSHLLTGNDLQIAGNIVWAEQTVLTCPDGIAEADNLYWASDGRPRSTSEIAPTSRTADPRLVDPAGGDLRLLPDSPAIDAIRPMDLGDAGAADAAGVPVPQGYAPDIGAYEYTTEAAPSSMPGPFLTPEPVTPSSDPRPSQGASDVPPPTGGPGGLDQLIVLAAVLGTGGLLAAFLLARRSPV